ncbi:hypothetical protein GCM10022267_31220 [Lentzea roselyniae]|uniref:Multicopper oxidase with three cupredoxin domains (Includes cell division protein FtsP and spore coat protein CotA) n=1 Tax=Lentzea roselyniae TaxID=531940 RepID=A0ABP7AWQ6_9PSEU
MVTRRAFLQQTGLAAGVLVFAPHEANAPSPGFPQPSARTSAGGRLETTLRVGFAKNRIRGLGTIVTRAYEGSIPGPTLRVRPGDKLVLNQLNLLPPNPDQDHVHDHNTPHHFNTFNLHTHGLHVDPGGIADNVFRSFTPRDPARGLYQARYRSEVHLPPEHEAGTYWYHPHTHGSSVVQLLSGMAGVLIVEGAVDRVPQIAAAADVVVCISELKLRDGRVPELTHEESLRSVPSTFLVNGERDPLIRMRPGEVHRWRLVNAGAFTVLGVRLEGHGLHQIAQDGLTFPKTVERNAVPLAMGGRADVMVQAAAPGRYRLMAGEVVLMTVEVAGTPRQMELPDVLPGTPTLPFIGPGDLTPTGPHGNGRRTLIFRSDEHALHGAFTTGFRILGDGATPATGSPNDPMDPMHGRFDPDFVNHRLPLGGVEEWLLRNETPADHSNHPFHIHTNPFLVVAADGVPLPTPVWHDTVSINQHKEVVIRLRFERFRGRTVLHCHHLQHEDQGMMQLIEYL